MNIATRLTKSLLPNQKRRYRSRITKPESDLVIRDFLESLDCPRALTAWMLYRYGNHRDLVSLQFDPDAVDILIHGIDSFKSYYLATKFFSKTENLRTGIDKEEVALQSAAEAEQMCLATNERFLHGFGSDAKSHELVFRVQRIISRVLGPLPPSFPDGGWSSGRTSSAAGYLTSQFGKYTARLDATYGCRGEALSLARCSPIWGASVLNADAPCSVLYTNDVIGNTMITVPKNAKTDRVICYEPHMNIRLQLSVGTYIRKRLAKAGVNLNDQSINQRRAKLGSVYGKLSTIDLEKASDTLAFMVVRELLPIDWAEYLDSLRSKYTKWPDGLWRENQKFSSMGNGFTFELESLIFYAICSSCSSGVSVFGDDIVIPTDSYLDAVDALAFFGFKVNLSKSYSTGFFRESCGEHYVRGVRCSPVYLRRIPSRVDDVVKLHNLVLDRSLFDFFLPKEIDRMLSKWRRFHPCDSGPKGYGDGHYHVNPGRARRANHWVEGYWFTTNIARLSAHNLRFGGRGSDVPLEDSWAALCATLGPSRPLSLFDTGRVPSGFSVHRALASDWPWWAVI